MAAWAGMSISSAKGYPVYVVDQVSRGRSAADPSAINDVILGKRQANQLPAIFTAAHEAAWALFRFGPEYSKAYQDLQYPLDAMGELWKQIVPDWTFSLPTPNPTVKALSELAIRLESTVLVSHSQSELSLPGCGAQYEGNCRHHRDRACCMS